MRSINIQRDISHPEALELLRIEILGTFIFPLFIFYVLCALGRNFAIMIDDFKTGEF